MPADGFQVGDRVRVGASAYMPAGRTGIIVQSFSDADDLFDVQFDDNPQPYLMLHCELERVCSAANAELRERAVGG
jgi:hypothetical protein